ncbi:hypothetical protein SO802_034096 [Lithocarpus litseifolius]|uniref:DUF4283 domain-containing protein n=1 Tax=Lithocarpus litseifolius TaxID=425828 RepID=A0AAW2BF06_9ROSI
MDEEVVSDEEVENIREGLAAVKFSREFKWQIRTPWSIALIVKVYGRTVGFNFIYNRLLALWKPTGRLDCVGLGHGFFLTRFSLREDYENILKRGPWFIGEHFLSIRPWELDFRPATASVTSVAVWVRLNELPIECYNSEALLQIGKSIGNVLRVDTHTATKARGSAMRVSKSYASLVEESTIERSLVHTPYYLARLLRRRERWSTALWVINHALSMLLSRQETWRGPAATCMRVCMIRSRKANGMKNTENRTWATSGNVKALDGPVREAKRKHSPQKVLTEAQVAHTQNQSPDITFGPIANTGLVLSGSAKQKTPSVSDKGKRVASRTKVSKDFSSNTSQTPSSQAQEGFLILPRPCAQSTWDGKPIKGNDGGSKPRSAAEVQLSSLPWLVMGFKFGESSSGSSGGGISRVSSKPNTSDGVVQPKTSESMDKCVSLDRGE